MQTSQIAVLLNEEVPPGVVPPGKVLLGGVGMLVAIGGSLIGVNDRLIDLA